MKYHVSDIIPFAIPLGSAVVVSILTLVSFLHTVTERASSFTLERIYQDEDGTASHTTKSLSSAHSLRALINLSTGFGCLITGMVGIHRMINTGNADYLLLGTILQFGTWVRLPTLNQFVYD